MNRGNRRNVQHTNVAQQPNSLKTHTGDDSPLDKTHVTTNEGSRAMKYLTDSEVARLFETIAKSQRRTKVRDAAIFRVAYHRGLRASEIGMLQLDDYRPEARRLYVHRLKGSHSGEYILTDAEQRALQAWLRVRGTSPGILFPSEEGTPINRRTLHVLIRTYGTMAGLPADKQHMHSLKHSCATTLLSTYGVDIAAVQDHLGHADIRNTQIYAKITSARRIAIGEALRGW